MIQLRQSHIVGTPMKNRCVFLVGAVFLALTVTAPAEETAAGPDAWPLFRGTATGSGRSVVSLRTPLAEHWQRRFAGCSFAATPVISKNRIYIGDLDGRFLALSLETGKTLWEFESPDSGFPAAAAVSTNTDIPLVVVGDDLGVLRAFDCQTGALQWSVTTEGEISGGPTILIEHDPPTVLVGSQDATLLCLRLVDGKTIWTHEIDDQIRCSPTVGQTSAGPRVFLAGCDGSLHIIDALTGASVATVPLGGPTGTTPAVLGSQIFFGTEGGRFFAINFVAGVVDWQQQPATRAPAYRASAAVAEGIVVIGSRGRVIEAFATFDGSRLWRQPLEGRVDASPVMLQAVRAAADTPVAVVLVADATGRVAMLQLTDGTPCWEFDAGGSFVGSPAVVADHLLLANEDGTLWCFRSATVDDE